VHASDGALMPALSKQLDRRYRTSVAARVNGVALFDAAKLPDLDTATTCALERVRAAHADESQHECLKLVQTPFKDGVAAAVIGLPHTTVPCTGSSSAPRGVAEASPLVTRSWALDTDALLERVARYRT